MPGGLYKNVKISKKAADALVLTLLGILVAVTIFVISNNGFVVEFNSLGGTDVGSLKVMYGEIVGDVEAPKRQGYRFLGWYKDKDCTIPFNTETEKITESIKLYAKWE